MKIFMLIMLFRSKKTNKKLEYQDSIQLGPFLLLLRLYFDKMKIIKYEI